MPTLTNLVVNLTGNDAQFRKVLRGSQGRLQNFASNISTITKTAFVGAGILTFARSLARADSQLALIRGRLDALGGADISIDQVRDSADKLGISFEDAGKGIARFLLAGQELGLTSKEAIKLQEVIASLGRIGGASQLELSSGILQFSQALASGRLQGDELRSILENLPLVAQEIAKGFGVGVGQLKEMGKDGLLTSEAISKILLNVEGLEAKLAQLPTTLDIANARLGNATTQLLAAAGASELWVTAVEKVALVLDKIATVIEFINRFMGAIGGALAGASAAEQRGVLTGETSKESLKKQDETREAIDRQTELLKQRLSAEGVNLGFGP